MGLRYANSARAIMAIFSCLFVLFSMSPPASAQDTPFIQRGDAAVTGFSGTAAPPTPLAPGTRAVDETFIDLQGKVMRLYSLRDLGGPANGALVNLGPTAEISAGEIGQVFGTAFDDGIRPGRTDRVPSLYLTATSMFGLQIVIPDRDGDGRPERVRTGRAGARWMDGQFGTRAGGGPGAIWKLDGLTGQISLFANLITEDFANRGGALGNIAFDPKSRHLYVSDLETGLITAFDLNGNALYAFDHGINGRPNKNLDPVADDSARRADITRPEFDAEDPETWGYADPRRRVFGLGVRAGRLYYAVNKPLSIWSVALNDDGSFAGSSRWEFNVTNAPRANDISDITFDTQGRLYIAQRGKPEARYDYTSFAKPRRSLVRIYRRERPDNLNTPSRWIEETPGETAIGFPVDHHNTTGGIALGYGYNKNGRLNLGSCRTTLWTTGEQLRQSAEHAATLIKGGPLNVNGLQGNHKNLLRPKNAPPWQSWFIDFDNRFDDVNADGHMGDVEIFSYCPPGRASTRPPHYDLKITKRATSRRCFAGKDCEFEITIKNISSQTYRGPLYIQDGGAAGALIVDYAPRNAAWECEPTGYGTTLCKHAPLTLQPGKRVKLSVTATLPASWKGKVFRNCATIKWWGGRPDQRRRNDTACAYVPTCKSGDKQCTPDIKIEKYADTYMCDDSGKCSFWIAATNVGGATYRGRPKINDHFAVPGATLIDYGPAGEWSCNAGSPLRCTHTPVTLAPGDSVWLNVQFQLPLLALNKPAVYKNCAATHRPVPGDNNNYSPLNDFSCAPIAYCPPGAPAGTCLPDLKITKTALSAICLPGAPCSFAVEVRNTGTADYIGPVEINDPVAATGMTFVGNSAGWTCQNLGGTRRCRMTTVPAGSAFLAPGDSVWLQLDFMVPAGYGAPFVQNCASLNWPGPSDANPGNDGPSCVSVPTKQNVPTGEPQTDWSITKTAEQPVCFHGAPCVFNIQVTNHGPGEFLGVPGFQDPVPAGLVYEGIDPLSPWECTAEGDAVENHVSCSLPTGGVAVPPGDMPPLRMIYRLHPEVIGGGAITNTVTVNADAETDPNFANNSSSASVIVAAVLPASATPPPTKTRPITTPPVSRPPVITPPRRPRPACGRLEARTRSGNCVCKKGYRRLSSGRCGRISGQTTPTLRCNPGWTKFARGRDFPKGWQRSVKRRNGKRILCGKAPRRVETSCRAPLVRKGNTCSCPAGLVKWRNTCLAACRGDLSRNFEGQCACPKGQTRRGSKCFSGFTGNGGGSNTDTTRPGNDGPRPLNCPRGWTKYWRANSVPRGWKSFYKGNGVRRIYCAKRSSNGGTNTGDGSNTGGTRITCSGGRVSNGVCRCPAGKTRKQRGKNYYVCTTKPPRIACINGTVNRAGTACLCRSNQKRVRINSKTYRCDARIIETRPSCVNGRLRKRGSRWTCQCAKGLSLKRGVCTRAAPRLRCDNGYIRGGQCRCSKNRTRQSIGRNAWRCVTRAPSITAPSFTARRISCLRGYISKGRCYCRKGRKRVQTGKNAYRCDRVINKYRPPVKVKPKFNPNKVFNLKKFKPI